MVVVITGASAGIGAALARSLYEQKAHLVLAARRLDRLEALNRELGGQHLVVRADVSEPNDCQNIVQQTIRRFGRIDTLVANAGYGIYDPVVQTTPQQTREIFATNVFGTTDLVYAAAPFMFRQDQRDGWRGQIMIVSSVCGRRGVPFLGMYSGTKSAQLAIAEAMRVELEPHKIAVTTIHPIMTKTDFGRTAETRSRIVLPQEDRSRMTQSVEHVARRMIEAIRRPRPEVWPSQAARIVVGFGTLMPGLVDRVLSRYRDRVREKNPSVPL
ncbi:MAG: short-chain dehydrogenase [Phycisphaerae bacterium]|jgi:short-subunit dehydrogenase|nr:MAG: short-chain dehydrogenase [Phycisphaerae bacterium]